MKKKVENKASAEDAPPRPQVKVKWTEAETDAEAEDNALTGEDEEEE